MRLAEAVVGHLGRRGGKAAGDGGEEGFLAASREASDPSQKLFGDATLACPSGTQETGYGAGEGGGLSWWGQRKEPARRDFPLGPQIPWTCREGK